MYTVFLSLHNILRWVVLIVAILALIRMYFGGWGGRKAYSKADDRASLLFTIMLDLQVLLGIILYVFLSPSTMGLLNGTSSMSAPLTRYFGAEHAAMMLLAVIVAHVGRAMSKKAADARGKFRRAAIWYTIALVLLLVGIPWPFLSTGRPWFRLPF